MRSTKRYAHLDQKHLREAMKTLDVTFLSRSDEEEEKQGP
jgi:hypothetical protein